MSDVDQSAPPRGRRTLPVGPLGLLLITAIAIVAATGAARLAISWLDDDPEVVDVQDMLDASTRAPLVSDTEARAQIGAPAPNVRLEYLDGGVQDLDEVAGTGTPVVLNFWSSTCIPCRNEMPAFEEVRAATDGVVTFVGIDVTDTVEAGNAMVESTGVRYRNARDPQSEIFALYGGIALPRSVLIDADGVVVATHSGELDTEELTALLEENGFLASR